MKPKRKRAKPRPAPEETKSPAQLDRFEFESKLAKFSPSYQRRYRELYALWLNPTGAKSLSKYQHDELVEAGLVRKAGAAEIGTTAKGIPVPGYCSQREFAKLVGELYGMAVSPMQIGRAIQNDFMPGLQPNGSIKTALAIPWWEEHKVHREANHHGSLVQESYAAELRRKIDAARRERIEADAAEREHSEKWMLVDEHKSSLRRAGSYVWGRFCLIVERQLPNGLEQDLKLAGLPIETVRDLMAKTRARHQFAVDTLQREMAGVEIPVARDVPMEFEI